MMSNDDERRDERQLGKSGAFGVLLVAYHMI